MLACTLKRAEHWPAKLAQVARRGDLFDQHRRCALQGKRTDPGEPAMCAERQRLAVESRHESLGGSAK